MPRSVDHEERRREIALAVWRLVAAKGMEAVTFRAVADAAGISVGRIQHYFANRQELIRHSCRTMIDMAGDAFAAQTADADPLTAFRALVMHVIPGTEGLRVGTYAWYAYLAKSIDDAEIEAALNEALRGTEEYSVELLRSAQRRGDLDAGLDASRVARRLLALADGLAVRVLIGQITAADAVAALDRELAEVKLAP